MSRELFVNLPDEMRNQRMGKFLFSSVSQIPLCQKYTAPKKIKFIDNLSVTWSEDVVVIEVDPASLIALNEQHYLCIEPSRYDKVKEAISCGEIDMGLVELKDDIPIVTCGRHRLIALYKFGVQKVQILTPQNGCEEIINLVMQAENSDQYFSLKNTDPNIEILEPVPQIDKQVSLESWFENTYSNPTDL